MLGYVIPHMVPQTLHPKDTHFDAAYRVGIYGTLLGLLGVMAWLQNLSTRYERVRLALQDAGEDV
jgi:hypothetical protein